MGVRKITVKQSVAESIAAIALYIESKSMVATAEKFSDNVYDYFIKLADTKKFIRFVLNHTDLRLGINVFLIRKNIRLFSLKQKRN